MPIILFFLILLPSPAWAIIPHEYPGVYPHQVAHVFVTITTAVFVYYAFRHGYTRQRGFGHIAISAILFQLWNLYTFFGHFAELYVGPEAFANRDSFFAATVRIETSTLCYYLYRLDHLILAPCLLFFLLGLRAMLKETKQKTESGEKR